jgi:hypothetical protein
VVLEAPNGNVSTPAISQPMKATTTAAGPAHAHST